MDGKVLYNNMQIEIGKRYVNKTWRFLYPCLRGHGDVFVKKFNPLYKLAVGVSDDIVKGTQYSKERNIFILIDTMFQPKLVQEFLSYITFQPFYKHHYYVDNHELTQARKMMLVLSVPDMFYEAYDNFIIGRYSQMYDTDETKKLFSNIDRKKEFDILTKNYSLEDEFIKSVNEEFDTNVYYFDEPIKEYELPLKPSEEIFNYQSNNYYLIKELDKV